MKKVLKKVLWCLLCAALVGSLAIIIINARVKSVGKAHLITAAKAAELSDIDCIIVLGCQVRADGSLSDMLRDRLDRGIALYKEGAAPKIIMSGDHGQKNYDEVNAMKDYAINNGVPSKDVFMDHAGFSTYESVYRAKEIFEADSIIIVTQEYHLYRALYIAERFGIEVHGVSSDYHAYAGQAKRECREILARCKDFLTATFKPKPTYLGETIPVNGNGDATND